MAEETTRYNQSILMFGDLEIVCGGFNTSFKSDTEDYKATNSSTPYDTSFDGDSVEAEAKDVDPALRKEVKRIWANHERRTLVSYDYDEDTGDVIEDDVLYNTYIKEIGKENGNKPFSIKFGARGFRRPN